MDQLLSKLTNLSYELFGIFIPGFVLFLFLGWWWWCVGDLAPILSVDYLPTLAMRGISDGYVLVPNELKLGLVIYVAVASYFLGHLINWVGRSGGARESSASSKIQRAREDLSRCLKLSIPKPRESYSAGLEPLLAEGVQFLQLPPQSNGWSSFYPVAKSRVAQQLTQSLIVTYQNKYTLHRSLAIASAIWFWLTYFLAWFGAAISLQAEDGPRWLPVLLSLFLSVLAVWGFSESYRFHWKMFGNSVISETFVLSRLKK